MPDPQDRPDPQQGEAVTWRRDPDGIATLTLGRPSAAALTAAADRLAAEAETVRGVVLTLAGEAYLSGGPDALLGPEPPDAARLFDAARRVSYDLRRIETLGRPVVAVLGGDALGGVLEIALACHHRIVLDAPAHRVGLPAARLGLLPGGEGITRGVRLLGIAGALRLLEGRTLSPADALELGLVHELAADHAEAATRARAWLDGAPASRQPWDVPGHRVPGGTPADPAVAALLPTLPALLRRRTGGAPAPAAEAALAAAVEGAQVDFTTAGAIEARYAAAVATGPVAANTVRALHADLNTVRATARPSGPAAQGPWRIAVLGADPQGLARQCADAGADVADAAADLAGRDTVLVTDRAALRHAEEAAPDAVLCVTDPALPLAEAAKELRRPGALVGLHLYARDPDLPLAEVTRGAATGDAATARAYDLARALGRTAVVVRDAPGSFVTRLTGRYLAEGLALLAEGVPAPSVEQAAAQAGFRVPVLALLDELGPAYPLPADAAAVLARMTDDLGRRGRAAGAGCHDDEDGRRVRRWPGPPLAALRERLLLAPAREARRLLDEGAVASAADANVASILGAGYPAWTGGAVRYAMSPTEDPPVHP